MGFRADGFADLHAVHQRHHDVEDGHLGLLVAERRQRLLPIAGGDHLEPGGFQMPAQPFNQVAVVISEENFYGHDCQLASVIYYPYFCRRA